MCGAMRFETTIGPDLVLNCHYHSCRAHTALMVTFAVLKAKQVLFEGIERKIFRIVTRRRVRLLPRMRIVAYMGLDFGNKGQICAAHVSTFDDPETLRLATRSIRSAFPGSRLLTTWHAMKASPPAARSSVMDRPLTTRQAAEAGLLCCQSSSAERALP